MADPPTPQPAKPYTACLGCRRRKLRCSREADGCANCTRSELPCVYPAPETGKKKKRGPYRKDKPARERHLEDLVKYLEPKQASLGAEGGSFGVEGREVGLEAGILDRAPPLLTATKNAHSEDLVKDALFALTRSCVSENESRKDDAPVSFTSRSRPSEAPPTAASQHPPIRQIFEYWHIYQTRVDPVVKLIHCPTFGNKLFAHIDNLAAVPPSMETLMYSIYYITLTTCTAREARARFGESRETLMLRFGRKIEAALSESYGMPNLESLQALVLYIIPIRRRDEGTNFRTLFALAVRLAQILGVDHDPVDACPPFERQLRRRLWWQLCGLESRGAEEGGSRTDSIARQTSVHLPGNFNDCDLDPGLTEPPQPRVGVTQMTFVRLRHEMQALSHGLAAIRKQLAASRSSEAIRLEQTHLLGNTLSRLHSQMMQYLDLSRPYDWLCYTLVNGLTIKARLQIDFPSGLTPTKSTPPEQRKRLLEDSVEIIRGTLALAQDARVAAWAWYFRGYMQWHSLAIVVAELGWSANPAFADSAWEVLEPILAVWDEAYARKRDEVAWEHVNGLISRARHSRQRQQAEALDQRRGSATGMSGSHHEESALRSGAGEQAPNPYPITTQRPSTPNGYAPEAMDFDVDSSAFDGLDDVDFGAFDEVFTGGEWDLFESWATA